MRRCTESAVIVMIAVVSLMASPAMAEPPPAESWWSTSVTESLTRAGERRSVWESALHRAPPEHRAPLAFLIEHMPTADLQALDPEFVLENVALAMAAREEVPWGNDLPDALFLNDVLPYASISEARDPWRAEFKSRFMPIVEACTTPAEAAHRLNQQIFSTLGVKYSTERRRPDQSPAESIETGMASCTGLSILLVNACRATGVPARLVGIPSWANKDGNHTWVEIWDRGQWHFAGAAEPDSRGLDHAWFVGDASLAQRDDPDHAIYAISFRRTGLEFPMRFDPEAEVVPAVNVTDRYAKGNARPDDETRLLINVVDADGHRVAARVTVRCGDDATATFSGVSRDASFDTNDLLAFRVDRGARCTIAVQDGAHSATRIVDATTPEQSVTFRLDR